MCCLYKTYMSESVVEPHRPEDHPRQPDSQVNIWPQQVGKRKTPLQSSTSTKRDSTTHRQKPQLVHTYPAKRQTVTTQFLHLHGHAQRHATVDERTKVLAVDTHSRGLTSQDVRVAGHVLSRYQCPLGSCHPRNLSSGDTERPSYHAWEKE